MGIVNLLQKHLIILDVMLFDAFTVSQIDPAQQKGHKNCHVRMKMII